MDVDRYITDDARAWGNRLDAEALLRAALPGILAQHWTDTLRLAADRVTDTILHTPDDVVAYLRHMADEAVAE